MSFSCPKHKKPSPSTCSLCGSWATLEKEKQRLSLQQQKLDLDKQLLKAEKKKVRRSAQVSASTQSHDRKKYNVDMQGLKTQREQQVEQFQEEIKFLEEQQKINQLEWELKFSKQESDLAEAKDQIAKAKKHEIECVASAVSNETEKELLNARTEIISLRKELESITNDGSREKNERELNEARSKIDEMEKELEDVASIAGSKERIEKELDDARTKIKDLEKDLETQAIIAGSKEKVEQELCDAKTKMNKIQKELDCVETERRLHVEISTKEKQDLQEQIETMKEQSREKETAWETKHQSLQDERDFLRREVSDYKENRNCTVNLQENFSKIQDENERYIVEIKELKDQCAQLQRDYTAQAEELEDQRMQSREQQYPEQTVKRETAAGIGTVMDASLSADREDLEEEVYELKMKLNKRQVEHQRQLKELEDELRKKYNGIPNQLVDTPFSEESEEESHHEVKDTTSKTNTVKTAGEQQKERQIEIDRQKAESKVLALEAKLSTSAKEKAELEELLDGSKSETLQLALQLEKMKNDTEVEKNKLDEYELLRLKREMDELRERQEEYGKEQEKEKEEWNYLLDSLAQKQSEIFDKELLELTSKVNLFDAQISDMIEQQNVLEEREKQISEESNLKPPSPVVSTQPLEGRRTSSHRRPPLTKMDSRKNRHVTEFDFKSEKQCGKYTGFLNMQNLPQGHGILRVDTGDVYEGEWENGQRHGQGVYTWYDGDLYTGPWREGKRHGHGVFVFSDGRLYDGEYNMGQREGQGMFVWPYGAKYEGSYYQDKRNGSGVYVYADGRIYRGEYRDDRPHGYGVETAKDGTIIYDGNWAFGEFVGDGHSLVDGHSIASGSIISYRR
eukprot:CAMPEP_0178903642 /NCGR_PEP_ID=MMETSP0786-20121207/5266_1 /TAXON_ID=186022 /ORGANISM="Thalassionema frauenfeldii, Strain CCMP 1798" /LENGTH=853 /DNA_ID=CAMNT_0020575027 /DNA_START=141 /DNA_END=2702 /DNA_ORIENTATION=-